MTTKKVRSEWSAKKRDLLKEDIAAMIRERLTTFPIRRDASEELAQDIIVVARERFLREIETYARENIR